VVAVAKGDNLRYPFLTAAHISGFVIAW